MRALVAIPLFVLATSCAGSLPRPTDVNAVDAAERWPGTTREDLERGRSLYLARCSGCHAPVQPGRYPAARWHELVAEMAPRAKLQPEQREDVLRYVVSFARQARTEHTAAATPSGSAAPAAP